VQGMRYKPSKPMAVLGIVVGLVMLGFGLSMFGDVDDDRGRIFIAFWCLLVVAVTGLNVWAAFSKKGSIATIMPFGAEVEDDEDAEGRRDRR
jgi:hypothetical protein